MTEPIEDSRPPEPAEGARMSSTPARIALSAIAVVAVAAISVVLTLLVSDTDGPRTYTQAEVDAQLAAVRSAQPSPSPSPHAPGAEQIVVTDEGTFVGRCVSGQPLLARWTLNAGYRLPEPSAVDDPKRVVVFRIPSMSQTPLPEPGAVPKSTTRWGWITPGGWFSTGLLVENSQKEFIWESFTCREGVFAAGPEGFRYSIEITDKK